MATRLKLGLLLSAFFVGCTYGQTASGNPVTEFEKQNTAAVSSISSSFRPESRDEETERQAYSTTYTPAGPERTRETQTATPAGPERTRETQTATPAGLQRLREEQTTTSAGLQRTREIQTATPAALERTRDTQTTIPAGLERTRGTQTITPGGLERTAETPTTTPAGLQWTREVQTTTPAGQQRARETQIATSANLQRTRETQTTTPTGLERTREVQTTTPAGPESTMEAQTTTLVLPVSQDGTLQARAAAAATTKTVGLVNTTNDDTILSDQSSLPPVTAVAASSNTPASMQTTASGRSSGDDIIETTEETHSTESSSSTTQSSVEESSLGILLQSSNTSMPPSSSQDTQTTRTTVSVTVEGRYMSSSVPHDSASYRASLSPDGKTTAPTFVSGTSTDASTRTQEGETDSLVTTAVSGAATSDAPGTREYSVTTPAGSECATSSDCAENMVCETVNGHDVCVCRQGYSVDSRTGECVETTTPAVAVTTKSVLSSTQQDISVMSTAVFTLSPTGREKDKLSDYSTSISWSQNTTKGQSETAVSAATEPEAVATLSTATESIGADGARKSSAFHPVVSTATEPSEAGVVWEYSKPATQLSPRERAGSVSVVFRPIAHVLQWMSEVDVLFRKAVVDIINNRTKETTAAASTISSRNPKYHLLYPRDVVYIEPLPRYKNSEVILSFFIKIKNNLGKQEILPRNVIIPALWTEKDWIVEQVRWNITAVFGGVPSFPVQHIESGFFYTHLDLVIVVILVALTLLCLISLALVCSRCWNSQKARWDPPAGYAHYDRTKLALDMPYQYPDMGHDLATDEQCQEGEEKHSQHSSFINGNSAHIIKKKQDETWVVPFEDVPNPEKRMTVQDVEDTKL